MVGHFPAKLKVVSGAKDVITAHWNYLRGHGQGRWLYLFDEGLVTEDVANEWADEVWDQEEEE
jgi:hypothetical protein